MKRIVSHLAAMFSLVTATVAHAQFGSGIVYDPTQSAHAFTQIENEGKSLENQAQQIENGQQIFTNTLKIASTAIQTYNTVPAAIQPLSRDDPCAADALFAVSSRRRPT